MVINTATLLDEVPICLDAFIQRIGVTDTTAWRWRKKGWLKTRNILGRVYIAAEDLREFNRRMKAGDFAKDHIAPKKTRADETEDTEITTRAE